MKSDNIDQIIKELQTHHPELNTTLNHSSTFELLIATILSAQSTDIQVNKVTQKLFKKYCTPEDFAKLNPQLLEKEIKGCGLYKNKSKNIVAASKLLIENFDGKVPNTFDELIKLPGVGRKTANVVLSKAFNKDTIAVDTHVFRVSNRIGIANSSTPYETEKDLKINLPKNQWSKAHNLLIYHGRKICTARNPKCYKCRISSFCEYVNKNI